MDSDQQPKPLKGDDSSLEGTSTVVESGGESPIGSSSSESSLSVEPNQPEPDQVVASSSGRPPRRHLSFVKLLKGLNIYLLAFIVVLLVAAAILIITLTKSRKTNQPVTSAQNLTA